MNDAEIPGAGTIAAFILVIALTIAALIIT